MKKLALPISLLLVLTLFTLACNVGGLLGGGEKPVATQPPAGEKPAATTVPSGEEPEATAVPSGEEPTAVPVESEEEITYTSVEELDWINSYRSRIMMKWETLDEPKEEGSMEMLGEYVKDPAAQRFVMSSTGTAPEDTGTMEYIQIGDTAWMNMGEEMGGWMQVSADESDMIFGQGLFDFAEGDIPGGLEGARRVGDETVNGIPCHHYVFDETMPLMAMGQGEPELEKANGEIWISAKDGFTVKYTLDAEGKGLIGEEEDRPEHLSMEYEIYDINADIVIEPPSGAETGLPEDIPLMSDAQVEMAMEGFIIYSTASSVEDVVAFYQDQMPANGWTENTDSAYSMEGMAGLEFTKEGRTASLMITYDEESKKTNVMITTE